jgi:probable HAF family extracellular repeat protein
VFLICAVSLIVLAAAMPAVALWGLIIAALLVFVWRTRRWRDLDRRGRLFVVGGNVAAVVALLLAIGGLSRKPGDETRNTNTFNAAPDEAAPPESSPQSTTSPVAPRFRFTVTDLGTLGGTESHAEGINNRGQVVGGAWTGGDKPGHAFLWDGVRGMRDLGTLGGPSSSAQAINDAGQIVGGSDVPCQDSLGDEHAFLWEAGRGMQDLGSLGTRLCSAYGINKGGQVVGYGSFTLDHSAREGADLHAFQWDAQNGMCDMATHGIRNGWAFSINDSGQIVGLTGRSAGPGAVAFLWQAGRRMRDLGTLGGANSWAFCINNAAQVVGQADTTSGKFHAFVWEVRSGMKDLGTLGQEEVAAFGINNAGQIVGGPRTGSGSTHPAFIYSDGKMADLNTMIDPTSGWHLTEAKAINDIGQIVGTGKNKFGKVHAFLLTPNAPLQSPAKSPASQSPASQPPTDAVAQKPLPSPPIRRPLRYTVTELGSLGGEGTCPLGVNSAGQVVGYSYTKSRESRAFLWQASTGMRDLGSLGGVHGDRDLGDVATGVNNKGQVVGTAKARDSIPPHVFLWEVDRGMQDLGAFGGLPQSPHINDNGAIAVTVMTAGENVMCRAVFWQAGRAIDVDTPVGDCDFFAGSINNRGQIAGMATDLVGNGTRMYSFLWQAGRGVQELGTLGGGFSLARAVNDNGMVVGEFEYGSGIWHAFVWEAGTGMRDLGSLSAEGNGAFGINNAGQIVGGPRTGSRSSHPPFLYCDEKMIDLNTLIDPASGWHLVEATGINDWGQIVGQGRNSVGQYHAFLLTPVR